MEEETMLVLGRMPDRLRAFAPGSAPVVAAPAHAGNAGYGRGSGNSRDEARCRRYQYRMPGGS